MVSSLKKNAIAPAVNIKHRGLAVAFAVAALFAAQPAAADSLTYNGLFYSGADTVHITDTTSTPTIGENVHSGGFSMKDTTGSWTMTNGSVTTTTAKNASFMAWCIDIYDNMNSATYTLNTDQGYVPTAHVPLNTTRILALERLASNDLALVVNAKTSSAFQLAAWEIMAETSTTSYNLLSSASSSTRGNFYVSGDALGADLLAQSWLNTLGTATPTEELYVWRANNQGSTQDLAVFAPVPEPGTYAMMLAGLGLMGFIARRRKERDAA